jgi:hypothetical protein
MLQTDDATNSTQTYTQLITLASIARESSTDFAEAVAQTSKLASSLGLRNRPFSLAHRPAAVYGPVERLRGFGFYAAGGIRTVGVR